MFSQRDRLTKPRRGPKTFSAAVAAAAASLATLAVAVGGSNAVAATRPGPPSSAAAAAAVTWHKLALINGWASSQSRWGTGDPAWAVRDGIVYLAGSAHLPSGSNTELAVLPPAARPAVTQFLTVYTYGDTSGIVDVYPNGAVYAYSNDPAQARGFTSLAGLSFPAAASVRHKLTLVDGWKPGLAAWNAGSPAYTFSNGLVHLSGALKLPGKGGGVFAFLPKAARPARNVYIPVLTADFSVSYLLIAPNGAAEIEGTAGQSFTSLAGLSFAPAAVSRTALHLINGWQSGQAKYSTGTPSYSLAGGIVQLSGSLTQPASGSAQFAVLPAAIRPAHNLYIQVQTLGGTVGTVVIEPSGKIVAVSDTGTNAAGFTSLAGVTYPVNS